MKTRYSRSGNTFHRPGWLMADKVVGFGVLLVVLALVAEAASWCMRERRLAADPLLARGAVEQGGPPRPGDQPRRRPSSPSARGPDCR